MFSVISKKETAPHGLKTFYTDPLTIFVPHVVE